MGHRNLRLAAVVFAGFVLAAINFAPERIAGFARAADPSAAKTASGEKLVLPARTRIETKPDSGRFHAVARDIEWEAAKTAIVVCDMWDQHWCLGATRRVAQMAPRMNEVLAAARKRGVLIIHAPSETMEFYKDTPQRQLALQAPPVETKVPLQRSCRLDSEREGALPIDDSDGGCDCSPRCKTHYPWKRQIDTITIEPGDAIADDAQAYYLMKQRGIENVIVMGVHTNMCVLARPFSIRQLIYQGQNVVLMRDMTDTMYNSRQAPFVDHFSGTDLVVEHIEKHWCPTITSVAFLGGEPFRFPEDKRPHVAIVIAEDEYQTARTLPEFAKKHLGKDFQVSFVFAGESDGSGNTLPGIEVLDEADVALFSIRRKVLPKAQLDVVRKFIADGKPLVAVRTTSHAFSLREGKPPEGHADWPEFDRDVIGGNYNMHHAVGPKTTIVAAPGAEKHSILAGVELAEFTSNASLYKVSPLAKSATPLLIGSIPEKPAEPVAWVNERKDGGRVFYTSLGHRDDFETPAFTQLVKNALTWAATK